MDGQTPAEEAPFSVIVGMLRWGAQCGILLTRVGIVKHHDRMQVVGYATTWSRRGLPPNTVTGIFETVGRKAVVQTPQRGVSTLDAEGDEHTNSGS